MTTMRIRRSRVVLPAGLAATVSSLVAVIALVSGVISLAAIRGRDFAQQQRPGSPG